MLHVPIDMLIVLKLTIQLFKNTLSLPKNVNRRWTIQYKNLFYLKRITAVILLSRYQQSFAKTSYSSI